MIVNGVVANTTCPTGVICSNQNPDVEDPLGGENVDMNCTDTTYLPGDGTASESSVWLDWDSCPDGMAICGIRYFIIWS